MQTKTLQVAIAVVVFLVLQIVFFGTGEGRIVVAVASSLIFGLIYAAIITGFAICRGDNLE